MVVKDLGDFGTPVAILGAGNVGTDLLFKLQRSPSLRIGLVAAIDSNSDGLVFARRLGYETTVDGAAALAGRPDIPLVFDATSARAHYQHRDLLIQAGKLIVDLTPAAQGPYVIPVVNLSSITMEPDINLVSCSAQATVPLVAAVSGAAPVHYTEIVTIISSRSVGAGMRQNIDELTRTTADALVVVGGASHGKAIIMVNPAEPPFPMRSTVRCQIPPDANRAAILSAVMGMVDRVRAYVPGYRLKTLPVIEGTTITISLEIEGAGDYLPAYAGNLDIMTTAAVAVAELLAAQHRRKGEQVTSGYQGDQQGGQS